MRHPLVMGNWKLNGSKQLTAELIAGLRKELSGVDGCGVAIAPPALYLEQAKHAISGSHIALGAQNVDVNLSGAFTGEVSAEMLKDIGAKYIIIGHSERRTYHKESDEFIAKKYAVLKSVGLIPVLCIGETEAENEAGKTEEVSLVSWMPCWKPRVPKRSKMRSSRMSQSGPSVPENRRPLLRHRPCTNSFVIISRRKMRLSQNRSLSSMAVQ